MFDIKHARVAVFQKYARKKRHAHDCSHRINQKFPWNSPLKTAVCDAPIRRTFSSPIFTISNRQNKIRRELKMNTTHQLLFFPNFCCQNLHSRPFFFRFKHSWYEALLHAQVREYIRHSLPVSERSIARSKLFNFFFSFPRDGKKIAKILSSRTVPYKQKLFQNWG